MARYRHDHSIHVFRREKSKRRASGWVPTIIGGFVLLIILGLAAS